MRALMGFAIFGIGISVMLAYSPGLNGPFVFDDMPNLVANPLYDKQPGSIAEFRDQVMSNSSGPLGRPLSMATFSLNHLFAPLSPFPLKLTNVGIHLINTILVLMLVRVILGVIAGTRAEGLNRTQAVGGREQDSFGSTRTVLLVSVFIASFWALHPIHLTNVLYVIQRMNALSGLLVLLGCLGYLHFRLKLVTTPLCGPDRDSAPDFDLRNLALATGCVVMGTVVGALSKENAALLPLFVAVCEYGLLRRDNLSPLAQRWISAQTLVSVVMPAAMVGAYLISEPSVVLRTYEIRTFEPLERSLTELRVLWAYLGLTFFPTIFDFTLYHDNVSVSTDLTSPMSTLFALLAWVALIAASLKYGRERHVWVWALWWYLAGHVLESSIFGLELMFEHRNYIPIIGPIIAAVYYTVRFFDLLQLRIGRVGGVLGIAVCLVLGGTTFARASAWGDYPSLLSFWQRHNPASARVNIELAYHHLYRTFDLVRAYEYLLKVAYGAPTDVGSLIEMRKIWVLADDPLSNGRGRVGDALVGACLELRAAGALESPTTVLAVLEPCPSPESIDRAMRYRLRAHAISVETAGAFRRLRRCVVEGARSCLALGPEIGGWFAAAFATPRMTRTVEERLRAVYGWYLFTIGKHDRGIDELRRAVKLNPVNPGTAFELMHLLIRVDRKAEAAQVLKNLRLASPLRTYLEREVKAQFPELL